MNEDTIRPRTLACRGAWWGPGAAGSRPDAWGQPTGTPTDNARSSRSLGPEGLGCRPAGNCGPAEGPLRRRTLGYGRVRGATTARARRQNAARPRRPGEGPSSDGNGRRPTGTPAPGPTARVHRHSRDSRRGNDNRPRTWVLFPMVDNSRCVFRTFPALAAPLAPQLLGRGQVTVA